MKSLSVDITVTLEDGHGGGSILSLKFYGIPEYIEVVPEQVAAIIEKKMSTLAQEVQDLNVQGSKV